MNKYDKELAYKKDLARKVIIAELEEGSSKTSRIEAKEKPQINTYNNFTREELLSEIKALKSKNDKRAETAAEEVRKKLEIQIKGARLEREHYEKMVEEIQKEREKELDTCNPTLETIIAWNEPVNIFDGFFARINSDSAYCLALKLKEALQNKKDKK